MKSQQAIESLFKRYLNNECTDEEVRELIACLQANRNKDFVQNILLQNLDDEKGRDQYRAQTAKVFSRLQLGSAQEEDKPVKPSRSFSAAKVFLAVAASLFLLFMIYWLVPAGSGTINQPVAIHDVLPGGNKATLVLSDGKQVELEQLQLGDITDGEGLAIKKDEDGQLSYSPEQYHKLTGFNTVKTPKGGQYKVLLPDGSKVWLNAASSITYPAAFNTNERRVVLTGEAYFEVASKVRNRKKLPFIVETAKQKIEVLGTRFNVNAYDDEHSTKTTLLEGKVKVVTENETVILKPSQQFNIDQEGISTRKVDVEPAVDWKNGDFIFAEENIKSIMRKIGRWYNVEIAYDTDVPDEILSGNISRNRNLSEVLRMLELSGDVRFRIENNMVHMAIRKQ